MNTRLKRITGFISAAALMLGTLYIGSGAEAAESSSTSASSDNYTSSVTLFTQTYEDDCTYTDMTTVPYGANAVTTVDGNKVMEIKVDASDYQSTDGYMTTAITCGTTTNIESDKYSIIFDMSANSPNAGVLVAVKNPYHSENAGFADGYALWITPATFVSKDDDGLYTIVDNTWYTYTIDVDVSKLKGEELVVTNLSFINVSRKDRNTGVIDEDFGAMSSGSSYGARLILGNNTGFIEHTKIADGVSIMTCKKGMRWEYGCDKLSTSVDYETYVNSNYYIDNVILTYTPVADDSGEQEEPIVTNIAMQPGADITKRNFTWFSKSSETGYITYAKTSDMVNGEFPENATRKAASRDGDGESLKAGYYNNKVTADNLAVGTEYSYQLSNGTDTSEIYTFKVGDNDGSFSFAVVSDIQMGNGNLYQQENVDIHSRNWGITLDQLTTDEAFADMEFVVNLGDHINTNQTSPNYTDNEIQYDGYFAPKQMTSTAITSLLGNHDNLARGGHAQHFNEPGYMVNEATGEYYGATKYNDLLNSADYWFTYDSLLFVVLNLETFSAGGNESVTREEAQAVSEMHLEFIDKVFELTENEDIKWKILLYHRSPYGSASHSNYTLDDNGDYVRSEAYIYQNIKEYMLPGIYDRGFDVVFSGHDHCYTRTHILKHETVDTEGECIYYGSETITPYQNTSGANYYTYADGTTTPTFVDWSDLNGVVHSDKKVEYPPVKVTDPDGLLHITASSGSGSGTTAANYVSPYTAVYKDGGVSKRQAICVEVTPTTLTFTNYGLGGLDDPRADLLSNPNSVLDTFTIEKTVPADIILTARAPESVMPGEVFTVDITASTSGDTAVELASVNFTLDFDNSVTLEGITPASGMGGEAVTNGAAFAWMYDAKAGGVTVSADSPVLLAQATFKAARDVNSATASVGFSDEALLNASSANDDLHVGFTPTTVSDSVEIILAKLDFIYAEDYLALAADQKILVIEPDVTGKNTVTYTLTYDESTSESLYYSKNYDRYVAVIDADADESYILSILSREDGAADEIKYDGDVNGDGKVTAGDAALISDMLHAYNNGSKASDKPAYTDIIRLSADIIGAYSPTDSYVTVSDAMKALLISVGLE